MVPDGVNPTVEYRHLRILAEATTEKKKKPSKQTKLTFERETARSECEADIEEEDE